VVKATTPPSAKAYLVFRIIGFLFLDLDPANPRALYFLAKFVRPHERACRSACKAYLIDIELGISIIFKACSV
jgi:hypothetical protein